LWEHRWAIAAYAVCEIAAPFMLISIGERTSHVSDGDSHRLDAAVRRACWQVRLSPADKPPGWAAGLVSGRRVVALLGIDVAGRREERSAPPSVLVATLGYAIAPIIVSRQLWPTSSPLGPVAASAHPVAVAAAARRCSDPGHTIPPSALWASQCWRGLHGAGARRIFFDSSQRPDRAGRASSRTSTRWVAVLLGVVVLDEHLGPTSVAGLVLILGGSWLSTGGRIPFNPESGK